MPFVPPDTLVLSGGGPDGQAFVGCVRWLEEHRGDDDDKDRGGGGLRRLKTIVGSSAGAIVGLLLAVGMTSAEMEAFVHRCQADGSFRDLDVEGLVTFAERLGVDDGTNLVASLRSELIPRIRPGCRASDQDVTFLELAKATGRSLVVCVSNLEEARHELMSVDTAPDMGVLLAVRMSFGVPLIFSPVRWRGRTYVDGCLFEFCPASHLVQSGAPASSVLVFRIAYPTLGPVGTAAEDSPFSFGLAEYLGLLCRIVMTRSTPTILPPQPPLVSTSSSSSPIVLVRTVDVPSLMTTPASPCRMDLASLSLVTDADGIQRYIEHGFAAAARELSDCDPCSAGH